MSAFLSVLIMVEMQNLYLFKVEFILHLKVEKHLFDQFNEEFYINRENH